MIMFKPILLTFFAGWGWGIALNCSGLELKIIIQAKILFDYVKELEI